MGPGAAGGGPSAAGGGPGPGAGPGACPGACPGAGAARGACLGAGCLKISLGSSVEVAPVEGWEPVVPERGNSTRGKTSTAESALVPLEEFQLSGRPDL
jgi:hypothetical protein